MDPYKVRVDIYKETMAYQRLSSLQGVAIPKLVMPAIGFMGLAVMATQLASEGIVRHMEDKDRELASAALQRGNSSFRLFSKFCESPTISSGPYNSFTNSCFAAQYGA
jgi:hypothetical protein